MTIINSHTKYEKRGELHLYCGMQKVLMELRWFESLM